MDQPSLPPLCKWGLYTGIHSGQERLNGPQCRKQSHEFSEYEGFCITFEACISY